LVLDELLTILIRTYNLGLTLSQWAGDRNNRK